MVPAPLWTDLALRLGLTVLAGVLFGLDRGLRGHAAGLRTMVLVGLAAALSMIEANLLLATGGKDAASFATLDVMRLPLGILTGVGFIGGGAILQRGGRVSGVTTAATLWIVTVIGLCFGGGQIGIGLAATVLGGATVWGLKRVERLLPRERQAELVVESDAGAPHDLLRTLGERGFRASLVRLRRHEAGGPTQFHVQLRWTRAGEACVPLDLVEPIGPGFRVVSLSVPSILED